jgi:hypothetical protein
MQVRNNDLSLSTVYSKNSCLVIERGCCRSGRNRRVEEESSNRQRCVGGTDRNLREIMGWTYDCAAQGEPETWRAECIFLLVLLEDDVVERNEMKHATL